MCSPPRRRPFPFLRAEPSPAFKIESLKVTVDFLKVPLGLKKPPLKEAVAIPGSGKAKPPGVERHKPRRADSMDNESQYSGYSYKSGHSRSSRKHR